MSTVADRSRHFVKEMTMRVMTTLVNFLSELKGGKWSTLEFPCLDGDWFGLCLNLGRLGENHGDTLEADDLD